LRQKRTQNFKCGQPNREMLTWQY